jgi:hypothetical protein
MMIARDSSRECSAARRLAAALAACVVLSMPLLAGGPARQKGKEADRAKATPPQDRFVFILKDPKPASIEATLVCASSVSQRQCVEDASAAMTLQVLRIGGKQFKAEKAVLNQGAESKWTFTPLLPLHTGDRVRLSYPDGSYSEDKCLLPKDKSLLYTYAGKQLTVFFPCSDALQLRIKDADGNLLLPPVAPALDPAHPDERIFNGIEASTGRTFSLYAGQDPEGHEYALTIKEPAAQAGAAASGNQHSRPTRPEAAGTVNADRGRAPRGSSALPKHAPAAVAEAPVTKGSQTESALPKPERSRCCPEEHKREKEPPLPPDTVLQATEGSTTVTGFYNNPSAATRVRVVVMQGGDVVEQEDAPVDSTSGKFTVNLNQPLGSEQKLQIFGLRDGGMSLALVLPVTPSVFDWGRVRAYFTLGIVVASNEISTNASGTTAGNAFNTNSASPFISFDLDKNWLMTPHFRVHSYFDARLTQIGTAAASLPSGSVTPLSAAASPASLLANKQAGSLQGGAYFPFVLTTWRYRRRLNSLYVAPLVKAGFYTTSDTPTVSNGISTTSIVSPTNFYKFYGFGVRVGHYQEYGHSKGRAPEQLSYLDFTVGRWGNFEYLNPLTLNKDTGICSIPTTSQADALCYDRERLWRYAFEGILKVPYTPFILGLSANVAAQHPHQANFIAPPDDLRFLFGVRFDSKTLLAPLTRLGGTPASP